MASNASAMAHGLGMHGTAGCLKSGVGDASDVVVQPGFRPGRGCELYP